jgi:uncharacterized DUF497 family protein
MLSFEWDVRKSEINERKHGIGFNLAERVFEDDDVVFRRDFFDSELRDHAVGVVAGTVLIVVVHTVIHEDENSTRIRIISARLAERRERRLYSAARASTE